MKKNLDNSMNLVSYHNINSGMTDLRLRQRKLIRSGCRLDDIHWRRLAAREVYGISKLLIISDLPRSLETVSPPRRQVLYCLKYIKKLGISKFI